MDILSGYYGLYRIRTKGIVHKANQPRGEDQTADFAECERIRRRAVRVRFGARGIQLSELVETDIDWRSVEEAGEGQKKDESQINQAVNKNK